MQRFLPADLFHHHDTVRISHRHTGDIVKIITEENGFVDHISLKSYRMDTVCPKRGVSHIDFHMRCILV